MSDTGQNDGGRHRRFGVGMLLDVDDSTTNTALAANTLLPHSQLPDELASERRAGMRSAAETFTQPNARFLDPEIKQVCSAECEQRDRYV